MSPAGTASIDRAALERALADAGAAEHALADGMRRDRRRCLLVYVVPAPGADHAEVRGCVDAALERLSADAAAVLVDCVPRGDDGSPDLAALAEVPVLDAEALGRYEAAVAAELGGAVAARIVPAGPRRRQVHVWDVDPGSRPSAGSAPRSAGAAEARGEGSAAEGRPAVASGGMPPAERAGTLADALRRAAASSSDGVRTVAADGTERFASFADLLDRGGRLAGALHAQGVSAGDRAIVVAGELDRFFPALWGCILAGAVPLTVLGAAGGAAPSAILDKLFHAWRALGRPRVVVGTAAEAEALRAAAGRHGADELVVVTSDGDGMAAPAAEPPAVSPGDTAVLQMSSGSTGDPKMIQVTHAAIHDFAHTSVAVGHAPGDRCLNWLRMDHVVPLVMCHLRDVVLGCPEVHVATDLVLRDPVEWLRLLDRHGANHTWAPNFGFRLVAEALERAPEVELDLSRMKTFVNAGEQCTSPAVEGFLRATRRFGVEPRTLLLGWGMAETCTVTTWKRFSDEGVVHRLHEGAAGDAVAPCDDDACPHRHVTLLSMGPPAPGCEVRVVAAGGGVTREGRIGTLQIRGRRVTPGYLTPAGDSDRSSFDGEGWFDTGDLAYMWRGEVVITGRAKEMILVHGANVYCHELESAVAGVEGVARGLVGSCGVARDRFGTEGLAVFFVPTTPDPAEHPEIVRRIQAGLLGGVGIAADYVVPLDEAAFPRTTSGKIQRSLMRKRLLEGAYDEFVKRLDLAEEGSRTLPDCAYELAWEPAPARPLSPPAAPAPRCVVAMDGAGLGDALCELWPHARRVSAADDPAEWSERLDAALGPSGGLVVYLPAYGAELGAGDAIDPRCGRDLLALCRALAARPGAGTRVVVASRRAAGSEPVAEAPALAPAAAFLMALSHEAAGVDGCVVDLDGASVESDARALAATCAGELPGAVLAWRDGRLSRSSLRSADLGAAAGEPPFRDGGCYLVSGGLGGVGRELLAELQARWGLSLVVIGRTPLEAGGEGAAARRSAFEQLTAGAGGGAIDYRVADVADAAQVGAVVAGAERRLGRALDGALHLAGEYDARLLADDPASTEIEGEAAFRSKVGGARVLGEVCAARAGSLFVAFTSVFGHVGTLGGAHYAAANRYVDAYAAHLRAARGVRAYSLSWGPWRGTGMAGAGGNESWLARRGVVALSPREARHLTLAALRRPPGHLVIGFDAAASPAPARVVSRRPAGLEAVSLAVPAAVAPEGWAPPRLDDDFGRSARVRLAHADAPAPEDGGLHELIAAIVGEVTGTVLDADRPFYDAGLDSVTILRIHNRMEERMGIEFERGTLFEHPTTRALAGFFAKQGVAA